MFIFYIKRVNVFWFCVWRESLLFSMHFFMIFSWGASGDFHCFLNAPKTKLHPCIISCPTILQNIFWYPAIYIFTLYKSYNLCLLMICDWFPFRENLKIDFVQGWKTVGNLWLFRFFDFWMFMSHFRVNFYKLLTNSSKLKLVWDRS